MKEEVIAGFGVLKTYEGQKDFDQTYKDIEIKKKLVPLGPADENGDIPYTEEMVEIVKETPIVDVIRAQDDSCGLDAYLKPYRMQGTLPPDVDITDKVEDFTIFDNVGDLRTSGKVDELFRSLPQDLQSQYGSPEKLLREISDAAIESYCKKVVAANVYKPEEIKEEK